MEEIIKLITQTPSGFLVYIISINIITFLAFAVDKIRAISNGWRISEKTLFGLSLFGGALGGLIAMRLCRHKTKKPGFKYGLPMMVVIHIELIASL